MQHLKSLKLKQYKAIDSARIMVDDGLAAPKILSLELISFPISYLLKSLPKETPNTDSHSEVNAEQSASIRNTFEDDFANYDSQVIFELSKKVVEHLNAKIFPEFTSKKAHSSKCAHFSQLIIPQFKLGTFSSLIQLADEIQKAKSKIALFIKRIIEDAPKLFVEKSEASIKNSEIHALINETNQSLAQAASWNFTRFKSDGRVGVILSDLQKEYEKLENSYSKKKADYCANAPAKGSVSSVTNVLDDLSPEELVKLEKSFKAIPNVDDILGSKLVQQLIVRVDRSYTAKFEKSYTELVSNCVPDSLLRLINGSSGQAIYGVCAMHRGKPPAQLLLASSPHVVAEAVDANFVANIHKKIAQAELCVSALAVLRNIWEITMRESLILLFHTHLLELYCESALVFGLPTLYVFIVYRATNHNSKHSKTEAHEKEFFFRQLSGTLEEDFQCPKHTLPSGEKCSFLSLRFPITQTAHYAAD